MSTANAPEMACIEYAGLPGISAECRNAVLRLLQFGDRVTHVRILTAGRDHCLLLTVNVGDLVVVKSGFASGYLGEGSRAFSYVLTVLEAFGAEIEEAVVDSNVVERIDASALTAADLEGARALPIVRPQRWHDYIFDDDHDRVRDGTLWREFPPVMPFAILDGRLTDVALAFWSQPDASLLTAYRRLEDAIRQRTGLDAHGAKLMSRAFGGDEPRLVWDDVEGAEREGRMSLFTGTFMAYRNRRAHREMRDDHDLLLQEFLLLNTLYGLERSSRAREDEARPR